MPHEPTLAQKTAARTGVVSLVVFIFGLLALRTMYVSQKRHSIEVYTSQQKNVVWNAVTDCAGRLSDIEHLLISLSAPVVKTPEFGKREVGVLKQYAKEYADYGISELFLYDKDGLVASAISTEAVANRITSAPIKIYAEAQIRSGRIKTRLSDVIVGPTRPPDTFILISAARIGTDIQKCAARDGNGANVLCPSFVVASVNTRPLSYELQRLVSGPDNPMLMLIDRKGSIISHTNPEFIGANVAQAYDDERYPDVSDLFDLMKNGRDGIVKYRAPSRETGKGIEVWYAVFAPLTYGKNKWSVAVTFQEKDVPYIRNLSKKYLIAALVWLLALVIFNVIYIKTKARSYDLERRVRQLADSAAVNDILRNVNSELNDAKRKLEIKTKEFEAIHREREAMIEKLEELQRHLFATFPRPTREHREIMRELRKIVRVLRKPAEGRFWKHVDDE